MTAYQPQRHAELVNIVTASMDKHGARSFMDLRRVLDSTTGDDATGELAALDELIAIPWRELPANTEETETWEATMPGGHHYWAVWVMTLDSWKLSIFDSEDDSHPTSRWYRTLDAVKAAVQQMEGERGS